MLNSKNNILFKASILAFFVISFVHIFVFPLYDINNAGRSYTKTFQDFEQSLCTNNIKHHKILKKTKCPKFGIVTILQGGRLGNQMWEYASVWALGRRTGLEPYIPRCIHLKLDQVFEKLSVPTFEEIGHCPVTISRSFVKSLDDWNSTNQSIILPKYSIQPELVLTWVQDIIQEFTFKKKLLSKSQRVLRFAAKNITKTSKPRKPPVFVGVHVRRTDYLGYLMRKHATDPAGLSFYFSAMKYFETKYGKVIFVMVSDDPAWCKKNFSHLKNIYVTSRNTPALDLAILASCNHSIFDYGTFGEWGAILSGGETVYFNLSRHSSARLGQLLPNWHTL